jgi:hypothetical protein
MLAVTAALVFNSVEAFYGIGHLLGKYTSNSITVLNPTAI